MGKASEGFSWVKVRARLSLTLEVDFKVEEHDSVIEMRREARACALERIRAALTEHPETKGSLADLEASVVRMEIEG